ncbi:YibE/F family protein [Dehalobacter sp. DCM]|uniref:YibE/F family protein n=1 Tax=Dehalobacter sp. DCM TaxID=2907827 RepID=UPI00308181D7|nr:YibE/F family protein [Dehalobacter sp. DCM]
MKKYVLVIAILFLVLCLLNAGITKGRVLAETDDGFVTENSTENESTPVEKFSKGIVVRVIGETKTQDFLNMSDEVITQQLEVKLTHKEYANQTVMIENLVHKGSNTMGTYDLKAGDRVVVYLDTDNEGKIVNAHIQDISREYTLYGLLFFFALALILLGRRRGLASLVSLTFIGMLIWFWFIPYIKNGGNPLVGAVAVCSAVTIITIPLVHGFNIKSFAAIIGTVFGVVIAGMAGYASAIFGRIQGIEFEYMNILSTVPNGITYDFRGIFLAGVLIGSLGAVMDTSISVASAIQEFYEIHPDIKPSKLWKTGMNVGRDVMSMMSSTLILAYTGGAIALLLLLNIFMSDPIKFLNSDLFVSEVIRMLSGSIGLILAVPITIYSAIKLVRRSRRLKSNND